MTPNFKTVAMKQTDFTIVKRLRSLVDESGIFGGTGVVTIKRQINGYRKVLKSTGFVLSKHELTLPEMEYDTRALWLDCHASHLRPTFEKCTNDSDRGEDLFDHGVHALSHALCVAAGAKGGDLDCDHSTRNCNRVLLYDSRPGGNGACEGLFGRFVGVLRAAVGMLRGCDMCESTRVPSPPSSPSTPFDGGCPSCVHSQTCDRYNEGISRQAGAKIGAYALEQLSQASAAKANEGSGDGAVPGTPPKKPMKGSTAYSILHGTPSKIVRDLALQEAGKLNGARQRGNVVGRECWPTDGIPGSMGTSGVNDNCRAGYVIDGELLHNIGWIEAISDKEERIEEATQQKQKRQKK